MTAPSDFETTPLSGDLSWLEAYAAARKTVRWTTHTVGDDATSTMALRWPQMAETYAGWQLEPEPEPPSRWERLRAVFR